MKPKTDPYWWEAIERETEADPEFAESYDAVVVGAGLTGASAARTLAKNGASVLVLDAEPPGFGASTRNGGMIGEGHRVPLAQMAKRYGLETAQALLREIYIEPLNFAKKTIAEEGLDCDFKTHGRFRGQWSKQEYDSTARSLDELREIAPINVEMVPRERQRDEVGSDLYSGGLLLHDHGGLHPGKYTNELVRAARQAGARVCGNTRVTGVKPAGSGFEVSTPSGMVRAQSVLMATNGSTCYLACLEYDGTMRWIDTANGHGLRGHFPSVSDLDGDGTPEIVLGAYIYNIDGSVRGVGSYGSGYYSGYGNSGYTSFGMDMDGDGQLEVVVGDALYDADGNTVCNTGYPDGQPGAADLDLDGEGEFVTVSGGSVYVFDTNCDYLASWSIYGGGNGGPPTIADYDGDGVPEIGLPGDDYYTVYETDGTILWSNAVQDHSSNSTGSSVFDFDGDGQAEVVYADETRLWIYDGATGTVLLEYDDHHSGTVNEYPIIADVDADGRAEIVVGNDGGTGDDTYKGLRVIGDAEDNWVTVRQVWNQHAYHISNVNDDLTIPTPSEPNWPQFNTFRQAGIGSIPATSAPDLWPEIVDVCQPDCGLDATVVVQVVNGGALMAAAGVGVSLYAEDAQGVRTLLDWTTTAADLDAGMISDSLLLIATAADLAAATSVVVVVDDDGAGVGALNECDEDNEIDVDVSGICL